MRIAVAMLACISAATMSLALADPPPSSTAPAATQASSTPAAPAAEPAKSASSTNELTPDEKHFINEEGYHVEMRRGDKVYCRYQTETGSRVSRQKICGTIQELKSAEQQAQAGKDMSSRMQQNRQIN